MLIVAVTRINVTNGFGVLTVNVLNRISSLTSFVLLVLHPHHETHHSE
jgi:hypothetical protein